VIKYFLTYVLLRNTWWFAEKDREKEDPEGSYK